MSASDSLKTSGFNNNLDSAFPERSTDITNAEPEKTAQVQQSVRDTQTHQQLGSRGAAPVSSRDVSAEQEPSTGLTQIEGSCDGEEKRDQSKEEPLPIKQQEGLSWQYRVSLALSV